MLDAACLGRTDLDWFDLECGLEAAANVCYTCPVINQCLNYAIEHELDIGVWGGVWGATLVKLQSGRVGHGRGRG
jgi:hypothetical protein